MGKERGNPALHFLDRYAGIPAVAILGGVKRNRSLPSRIERIGLLKTAGIGDTVLMSAAVADIRQAFPHLTVIMFSGRSNFEIACMLDGVDRVVRVPIGSPGQGWKAMRSTSVDVLLDFGQWSRAEALFARLSRAKFTIGFRTHGQHRHYVHDLTVDHSSKVHELENYRRLVRTLGVATGNLPILKPPKTPNVSSRDYAVLHLWPGGIRSELKQWPAANWLRLIEEIAQCDLDLVLTGGPSDRIRNEELMAFVPARFRRKITNAAGRRLADSCAILACARLVVSVNTGVMHMAAALGTPLVALHGPTSSKRWGPVSERAIVIDSPLEGSGYLNLGWEYPSRPPRCMESITYELVREACRTALEGKSLGKHKESSATPENNHGLGYHRDASGEEKHKTVTTN